jgi:putative nucleotide binding protein|tara:strand:+ start:341 stop:907 length:567 start_codon:yes stop_codon:yes gene_type:complete
LYRAQTPSRKYEEYAYILDFNPRGKSTTVRGRDGIIITAIGEERLTLLEVLGIPNLTFEVGEKIYIGKDGRTKISSVLGKMEYNKITTSAQSELSNVVEKIVTTNETKFVEYLNKAQPLTPRIHALELIPGIGKTYMKTMLEEREKKKFESYVDLQDRVGFKDPVKHISERIMDEISGESRMNLFVKR